VHRSNSERAWPDQLFCHPGADETVNPMASALPISRSPMIAARPCAGSAGWLVEKSKPREEVR
jgi:hypothetical protein